MYAGSPEIKCKSVNDQLGLAKQGFLGTLIKEVQWTSGNESPTEERECKRTGGEGEDTEMLTLLSFIIKRSRKMGGHVGWRNLLPSFPLSLLLSLYNIEAN